MTVEPGKVFDGVERALAAVADRLEASVPDELARLEDAHGSPVPPAVAGEPDLWRPPGLYARSDRAIIGPDDYPAVLIVPQGSGVAEVVDVADGAVVWEIPYRIRIFGFCRYFGAAEVAACRNRLALGVLQALFRSPRLADGISVDLNGWSQSFSEAGVDDADQSSVAGWWLEVTVKSVETVTLDSLAAANVITVRVHPEAD